MAITYNSGQEELQGGETIASLNAEKLELQNGDKVKVKTKCIK